MSQKTIIQTVNQIASYAKDLNIAHLNTEDAILKENIITVNKKRCVNFGSCSYLGLEFEPQITASAKDAIDAYGTQFSSSRAYISPIFYKTLEEKLSSIFEAPTIVTPTTTLGHIAAIPVLVGQQDAVILDHQVHNSVQTAVNLVKAKRTHVELVRHNRMDLLEKKIIELSQKYEKVWYMADGIYSMYGDLVPLDDIYRLLDKYKQFHFYVDDAHGMSCFGDKGQGYVLSERKIHERMVVATSFAKAFATGGGCLIFPNEELASLVRKCGGPLITSGPMQPSALGAANKVADMHLSGEIKQYQDDLNQNIMYTNLMLKKHGLPNLAEKSSPIFFVAVSLPKVAYKLIDRLKKDGYFLNLGIFPAVPIKNTGVRFTITRLHTFEQIQDMVCAMAKHFHEVLLEENVALADIYKAFKIASEDQLQSAKKVESLVKHSKLTYSFPTGISQIKPEEWNPLFKDRGTFDHAGLTLLEKSFSNNKLVEENCDFDYAVVRDPNKKIILATFLTTSISKDDMFAEAEISKEVEDRRINDPYYMTSKTLAIGSPITEGDHLYIDMKSEYWKEAMDILLERISTLQETKDATVSIIRDLCNNNPEMDGYMVDNGFFKIAMPENCKIKAADWKDSDTFYKSLSTNNKRHFRKNVLRNEDNFKFKTYKNPTDEIVADCFELYTNVKNKSLAMNTFKLPYSLFANFAKDENWEILCLYLNDEIDTSHDKKPVAMAICHKGATAYNFVLAGLDYDYNVTYSCYRQLLSKIVSRGIELKYNNFNLGYTSVVEKKRFSARPETACAYMQVKDNYTLEAIGAVSISKKIEDGANKRRILPV